MTAVLEASEQGQPPSDHGEGAQRHRGGRTAWWVAGLIAVTVALGGGGLAVMGAADPGDNEAVKEKVATVPVERGTLAGTKTVPGVLDYAASRPLATQFGGTVTAAAAAGAVVSRGEPLFHIDNIGVRLFLGNLPAWRAFESGMTKGPDVAQLEANLRALGFFDGEPDEKFTWDTTAAIYDWQEATGQEETGRIDFGRVFFAPSEIRIAEHLAKVGDQVGPGTPVVQATGVVQEVTADLKLADQRLGVVGAAVEVQLPGGETTTGKIASVGQPTEREANGKTSVVVPLVITLDDPKAVAGIQRANVTLDVPSEVREDVLSVPIEALIALKDGQFGVEVVQKNGKVKPLPVTTGLFAGGRVEISGDGVSEGLDVVVPES